ncbi:Sb-PDE family phosphodiesterase [Reichenbachiella sp. MALMAid0571]|uniref:Sb-PDE family phosphodiesterase n=1 Tax=Reichenbachiella sp. MALMAid0571 TaxID=3143939 RepID=UPI0032DE4590
MKNKYSLLLVLGILISFTIRAQGNNDIPDIPGYKTLKCDFHIHTVFSDGKVWPEIRVTEAINEGLDAIAITDHLKYGKLGKYPEVQEKNRNRSYEIALEAASKSELIVIRGAEITQGMPPGHINAIFLTDANIAQKEYMDTFYEARKQGAFIFWNHPHWKSPDKDFKQDGIPEWYDVHSEMLKKKLLMGIEIVNGRSYSKEAHQWCIEKNLTLIANSDIHIPIGMEYDLTLEHRPTTLVFAKEKSENGIKEALMNQRTALWFEDNIIGNETLLTHLFQESIKIIKTEYLENLAVVTISNESGIDYLLENTGEYSFYNKTNFVELNAASQLTLMVKTGQVMDQFHLKWSVKNMLVAPDTYLTAELLCKKSGIITDKKEIK